MKLLFFTTETAPKNLSRSGEPCIGISKNGTISVNIFAQEITGFKSGDKLALVQDEQDTENWYICKHEKGFECRQKSPNDPRSGLIFNHTSLSKDLITSLDLEWPKTYQFKLAQKPTTFGKTLLWGLLIKI